MSNVSCPMFNVQFPMSSCSKFNAVSIHNASKSMQKLSTPDTLMSLLIDPLLLLPTAHPHGEVTMHSKAQYTWDTYIQVIFVHRSTSSIFCFWVDCNFVKAHNRKASWHEKEESPQGSTPVTEILPPTPTQLNPHPTQHIPIPINPTQGAQQTQPSPTGKPLPPTSAPHFNMPTFPRVLVR